MQAPVAHALPDLLGGQVDAVEEEHQEDPGVDQAAGMQGAAVFADIWEQAGQRHSQQHAAEEPVGEKAFQGFERRHGASGFSCELESAA
ncbi:hypothetical protein D3C85_1445390 [compost metagenome]